MPLTVIAPGLLTLPVDAGQPGLRQWGVPVGGPADARSFHVGQALVGNDGSQLALEINFAGPTLRAEERTTITIVGAPFSVEIVQRGTVAIGDRITLNPGDILKIGGAANGARAYLCVPGGFTDLPDRPLQAGDRLTTSPTILSRLAIRSDWLVSDEPIRILKGPQFYWFLKTGRFEESDYTVAPASNRMGIRFRGEPLERKPGELTSEPVAPGAIQITNDGQPVVLGVDGQTIGGYPKIAHVIRADIDRIGQLRPGDRVRFRFVTMDEAERANQVARKAITEWQVRIETRQAAL